MHIEALQALLKQLKLYGMRQSVQDLSTTKRSGLATRTAHTGYLAQSRSG